MSDKKIETKPTDLEYKFSTNEFRSIFLADVTTEEFEGQNLLEWVQRKNNKATDTEQRDGNNRDIYTNFCYRKCNWKEQRLRYLKQNKKVLYCQLMCSGELHSHLETGATQAEDLYQRLISQMFSSENLIDFSKENIETSRIDSIMRIHANIIEFVCKKTIYI